jgi:hypothetical protein
MNIPKQIINGFIESELELFKNHFYDELVNPMQDVRSLSIAWVSYHFTEVISDENINKIVKFVDEVYSNEHYRTVGWYRVSALEAASFILTFDIRYANNLIQHLSCGQSWARGFIVESTSIICPLLGFNNTYLKEATEFNFKYRHSYFEPCAILFLCTNGSSKEKRDWLQNQYLISDKNLQSFFDSLTKANKYFTYDFFIYSFSKAKSYFLFKIMSETKLSESQQTLFNFVELSFDKLWKKEKEHPLANYFIDLSFLENN